MATFNQGAMVWGASYHGAQYLHYGRARDVAVCGTGTPVNPSIIEGKKCIACLRYEQKGGME